MNYTEVERYILDIPKFTKKNKHCHTKEALRRLGNPQDQLSIIHVAGTNGKGSVCSYTASILQEAGFRTGLFISPHLVSLRERFQINGNLIEEQVFLDAFHKVYEISMQLLKEEELHPTFFEFLFLMAMVIFRKEQVEYVVLETGLGGRLDATNVIEHPIATIITSISLDHTEILGETLEKVSYEKAGIIKENVPVIYQAFQEEVSKVIESKAKELNSIATPLNQQKYKILGNQGKGIDFLYESSYHNTITFTIPYVANYQVENAALALLAIETIKKLGKQEELAQRCSVEVMQRGLKRVAFEGRMEELLPSVIVDGAHNTAGVEQFIETVTTLQRGERHVLLFSAVVEKNYEEMIRSIATNVLWDEIIVTQVPNPRAIKVQELAKVFQKYTSHNITKITEIENVNQAFAYGVKAKGEGVLFCVGSLYLIGEVKKYLRR